MTAPLDDGKAKPAARPSSAGEQNPTGAAPPPGPSSSDASDASSAAFDGSTPPQRGQGSASGDRQPPSIPAWRRFGWPVVREVLFYPLALALAVFIVLVTLRDEGGGYRSGRIQILPLPFAPATAWDDNRPAGPESWNQKMFAEGGIDSLVVLGSARFARPSELHRRSEMAREITVGLGDPVQRFSGPGGVVVFRAAVFDEGVRLRAAPSPPPPPPAAVSSALEAMPIRAASAQERVDIVPGDTKRSPPSAPERLKEGLEGGVPASDPKAQTAPAGPGRSARVEPNLTEPEAPENPVPRPVELITGQSWTTPEVVRSAVMTALMRVDRLGGRSLALVQATLPDQSADDYKFEFGVSSVEWIGIVDRAVRAVAPRLLSVERVWIAPDYTRAPSPAELHMIGPALPASLGRWLSAWLATPLPWPTGVAVLTPTIRTEGAPVHVNPAYAMPARVTYLPAIVFLLIVTLDRLRQLQLRSTTVHATGTRGARPTAPPAAFR